MQVIPSNPKKLHSDWTETEDIRSNFSGVGHVGMINPENACVKIRMLGWVIVVLWIVKHYVAYI